VSWTLIVGCGESGISRPIANKQTTSMQRNVTNVRSEQNNPRQKATFRNVRIWTRVPKFSNWALWDAYNLMMIYLSAFENADRLSVIGFLGLLVIRLDAETMKTSISSSSSTEIPWKYAWANPFQISGSGSLFGSSELNVSTFSLVSQPFVMYPMYRVWWSSIDSFGTSICFRMDLTWA
jgi:hypothetical protein